tara:strand:+ start:24357 stop:24848 length:492 start_codon:yes stop_codon:yes gene_type:complete
VETNNNSKESIRQKQADSITQVTSRILDQYYKPIFEETSWDLKEQEGRFRAKINLLKIFCKYARFDLKLSLSGIGRYLNRDHATVLYHCRTYDNLYNFDEEFRNLAKLWRMKFKGYDGLDNEDKHLDTLKKEIKKLTEEQRLEVISFIQSKYLNQINVNAEIL